MDIYVYIKAPNFQVSYYKILEGNGILLRKEQQVLYIGNVTANINRKNCVSVK